MNKRDKNGQTALIYGMQQVYLIIRYLIVNIQILGCVNYINLDTVSALVNAGADVNAYDSANRTALIRGN